MLVERIYSHNVKDVLLMIDNSGNGSRGGRGCLEVVVQHSELNDQFRQLYHRICCTYALTVVVPLE